MGDTKPCPFCAEVIAASAKKCRYCNEWLDGSGGAPPLAWEGDDLIIPYEPNEELLEITFGMGGISKTQPLPQHACWICASAEGMGFKKKRFIYTPPWAYLGLLLGGIGLVLVLIIAQKRATLALPLCSSCRTRWVLSDVAMAVVGIVGFFGFPILCGVAGKSLGGDPGVGFGILAGFLLWVVALVLVKLLYCNRVQVRATRIDGQVIRLGFPEPGTTRRAVAPQGAD